MIPIIRNPVDEVDPVTLQLCARIEELEHEKAALLEENDRLREELARLHKAWMPGELVLHG